MSIHPQFLSLLKKNKKIITIFSLFVIFILGILLSLFNGYLWFVYPDREKYPVLGIDVSHHQGTIDWKQVKNAGVGFAYLKATEGDDWVDKKFAENYSGARLHGMPVGIYHFYSLRIPAKDQLDNIVRTVSGKILDIPIVIDLEFGGNSKVRPPVEVFQKDLQVLLDGVESFQGRKPVLYITYEFRDQYLQNKYDAYPLWIRDIFSFPHTISDWTIWQYKNRGHINGIEGFVDLNVLSGSISNLITP